MIRIEATMEQFVCLDVSQEMNHPCGIGATERLSGKESFCHLGQSRIRQFIVIKREAGSDPRSSPDDDGCTQGMTLENSRLTRGIRNSRARTPKSASRMMTIATSRIWPRRAAPISVNRQFANS